MRRLCGALLGAAPSEKMGSGCARRLGSLPARFRARTRPKLEARRRRGGRRSPRSPSPGRGQARLPHTAFRGAFGAGAEEGAPPRAAPAPPRQRLGAGLCRVPAPPEPGLPVNGANVLRSRSLLSTSANPLRETGRRGTHSRAPIFSPFCLSLQVKWSCMGNS